MLKYFKETFKYMLRSYPMIRKYVKEVEELYSMTPEILKERNNKRFLEILNIAYNKSPFYHKLYDEAGVDINAIRGIEDIDKLPVITKDMIREHADKMLTVPKWMCLKAHTSGTTGTPLMVYATWPALWKTRAYLYVYRRKCGFTMGKDVLVSLRGHLNAKENQLWIGLSKTLYLSSFNLRHQTTDEYYQAIQNRSPKAIEGYPGTLYTFACNLEAKGLKCEIPLCFTSSETLLDYQRAKIEKVFGTQIYDLYGTTERTIQLVESFDHKGYFESPGFGVNEYLEDGELTTSLIEYGFPMIRYRGGDILEFDSGKVVRIGGRASLCLYGKDGTVYTASALSLVLKDDLPIKYAQFVQNEDATVDFNIVPFTNFELTEDDIDLLKKRIDNRINSGNVDLRINIVPEDKVIYTSSGKFNFIVSNLTSSK